MATKKYYISIEKKEGERVISTSYLQFLTKSGVPVIGGIDKALCYSSKTAANEAYTIVRAHYIADESIVVSIAA